MRTQPDWRQIGVSFQTSRKSAREIAREHGITEAAIRKKAKAKGWKRPDPEPDDWNEPLRVKPTDRLPEADPSLPVVHDAAKLDPKELAKQGRGIILSLMTELDLENANVHLLAELAEIETAEDSGPHRRRALERALSLPVRAQAAKNLASALATLGDVAAPDGKKAQMKANADAAASAGRFAVPDAPKTVTH